MIMNVEAGSLYLVNGKDLEFAVAFNIEAVEDTPVSLKLGQGIPGYVAARGEAMVANEGHDASLFMPQLNAEQQGCAMRSVLCVPMISQGKVIGVIEVLNKTTGEFTPGDQDLLQSIASSVSIAIENASLYKETVTRAENERSIRRIFQKIRSQGSPGQDFARVGWRYGDARRTQNPDPDQHRHPRLFQTGQNHGPPENRLYTQPEFFSLMGGIVFKPSRHRGQIPGRRLPGPLRSAGYPAWPTPTMPWPHPWR